MVITPRSPVENSSGQRCRLGAMVFSEGQWYGFVSSGKFSGDGQVFQSGTGLLIGEVVPRANVEVTGDLLPVTELVRPFRFHSYAPIATKLDRAVICTDLIDAVESGPVLVRNDGMASSSAKIVSIDGPFRIEDADGKRTYDGAFEIMAIDSDVALAKEGDGGSAVVMQNGKLVGLMVGVAKDRYYCIQADQLLARYFPGFDDYELAA